MHRRRFYATLCVCGLLMAGTSLLAQSTDRPPQDNRPPFLKTLQELDLTNEQTREVLTVLREYRGNYRSETFKIELLKILTPEQVETLDALKSPPGSRAIPEEINANLDVVYGEQPGTDAKFLSLDIYAPKKTTGKLPVMVMIHGGGWRIGDKSNRAVGIDKAKYFTGQGFVYVSINYRLTPEVQHPGHVIDVAAAVAWVHDHIDEYGGAPETLFVMGHSAGAHLAALVATDETRLKKHDKELSMIDGVVLLDGAGYDIPAKLKLGNSIANSMYLKAFTENEATQKNASPIHHVKSGKEIPPFLIIPIARRADSNQLSEALRDALTAAEVEASIHVAEGKTHGSVNSDIGKPGDQPTAAMMEFLNRIMIGK